MTTGSRILIVEDNPTNLELMTYLLNAFGHVTLTAEDGEEGIAVAIDSRPDLILCDIAMPKMDGFAVVQRLKSDPMLASIPVIAVTASAMVYDREKILATGFDGYISKPIDPETFVSEVEEFLRPQRG